MILWLLTLLGLGGIVTPIPQLPDYVVFSEPTLAFVTMSMQSTPFVLLQSRLDV